MRVVLVRGYAPEDSRPGGRCEASPWVSFVPGGVVGCAGRAVHGRVRAGGAGRDGDGAGLRPDAVAPADGSDADVPPLVPCEGAAAARRPGPRAGPRRRGGRPGVEGVATDLRGPVAARRGQAGGGPARGAGL